MKPIQALATVTGLAALSSGPTPLAARRQVRALASRKPAASLGALVMAAATGFGPPLVAAEVGQAKAEHDLVAAPAGQVKGEKLP